MKIIGRGVVALALLAFSTGCSESGYGSGSIVNRPSYQVTDHAAHAGDAKPEMALVSLVFSRPGNFNRMLVVDALTQEFIGYQVVQTDDNLVVTVQLPLNRSSSPHLTFFCEDQPYSFRAHVSPKTSLSTFTGLDFDGPDSSEIELRDHGVELEVLEGEEVVVSDRDLTTLWVGNKFVTAARARFKNQNESGRFHVLTDSCSQGWFVKAATLQEGNEVVVENQEHIGLLVAPIQSTPSLRLKLEPVAP